MEEQLEKLRIEHESNVAAKESNGLEARKAGFKVQESDASSVSTHDSDSEQEEQEYGSKRLSRKRKNSTARASAFLQKARMREAFSIIDINNDGESITMVSSISMRCNPSPYPR